MNQESSWFSAAVLAWLLILGLTAAGRGESIWIEGEDAQTRQVTRHNWYDGVKKDVLSGGEWLSHFDPDRPGRAEYEFDAPRAGQYTFWIRANHVKSSLAYRLNGGDWIPIPLDRNQRGALNIARDNKPDLRFLAWAEAGQVALRAGRNRIELRMDSPAQNHGAVDCFCLTTDRWVPSGTLKPSDKPAPAAPDSWFAVVLGDDPLSEQSVTDVSYLVEAPAGKQGFLQADGDRLRFERAARPVKFWGINASPRDLTEDGMRQAARWYRKHGINLARQHTVLDAVGLLDAQGNFDARRLDRYDRWFAALKEQGIYTTWSVIYPHHGPFLQRHDGYDPQLFAELDAADTNHDGSRQAIVVNDFINLDRDLQDIAWRYFDKLLKHTNPYTGLAYKDDPALAILEFQNESNVFFHTLNGLRRGQYPRFATRLRQAFFEFVKRKYGDREQVAEAWGHRWDQDDRWEAGELGLMGAHHWGADGPLFEFSNQPRRAGDYIEFLTGLQRDYYLRREQEVRRIGFRGVTVSTAWQSGGPAASLANLLADTAAGMIDRHNYYGGGAGGHAIAEGEVDNRTHLAEPGRGLLALGLFQVEDQPFCVSEWSMLPPSPWKAEAAPLLAFYGLGLQGWDVSCHFACNSHRMGDGWPDLRKYATETPHYIGQFPALAIAIHRRDLREGDLVARRQLSRDDVFSGRDFLRQSLSSGRSDTGGNPDDFQDFAGRPSTSPAALAVGRVTVGFRQDSMSAARDLQPFHDQQRQVLISTTGELAWHYQGQPRIEVRAARTQAIVGQAGGQTITLPAVRVDLRTPFVSLIFTSLDDRPLAESGRILITAMARDQQTGSRYNEDWSRLIQVGGPPLLMEPVQATIRLAGATPATIRPLDGHGLPLDSTVPVLADGSFAIDGRYRAYYYEVRR